LERCASFMLAGISAFAIGVGLIVLDDLNGTAFNRWISGAFAGVGAVLAVAGQTEAANFVDGTLAGMRERLRTLREEASRTEKPTVSPEEINRITALLNE